MKLHYIPTSPNGIKVRVALEHLGLQAELISVNPLYLEHKTPEFLKLNPNGRLPVLEDDDFVLWESNAILQYLGSKKPESGFWPAEPRAQADVSRWMCWALAHWGPAISPILYENLAKRSLGRGAPDAAAVGKALEDFHRCAQVLDPHLEGRQFVCGDRLTAADLALAPLLLYGDPGGLPWRDYGRLVKWYQRVADQPSWRAAL